MFTLLHQCCKCWLGHVHRMEDGCIPKDLLYCELATEARCRGHPQLCYKDVCKHDMKACNIDTDSWEAFADDRTLWKQQVSKGLKGGEAAFQEKNDKRWARRTARHQQDHQKPHQAFVFTCQGCSRDCNRDAAEIAIQDWPLQPHRMMHISNLSGCYSIVKQLRDANNNI